MKHTYLTKLLLVILLLFTTLISRAQQGDDLLNVLIKKGIITEHEADSIRADAALKEQQQKDQANQHGVLIGSRALQLSGLIQSEYEGFQQKGVNNTFLLHRTRVDIKGDISDSWSYEVYTEFAGTTPKLLDAYATYKIASFLKFTAGQFKVPFSLESLIADSQLDFIDRTQIVNALSSRSLDVIGNNIGRDIGIQASGDFLKLDDRYLFNYQLGLFNGAGYDVTTDNNNHKDIAGRLTIDPIDNLNVSADFYNGVAYYLVSGAKTATNNTRNRRGLDARYVWKRLSLQAEYDKGTDATTNKNGWYGQGTYFILAKKLQLVGRYETYDPDDIVTDVRTHYYTGGFNYYFNDWVKFQLNYVDKREEGPQVANNIFEAQLQLTF